MNSDLDPTRTTAGDATTQHTHVTPETSLSRHKRPWSDIAGSHQSDDGEDEAEDDWAETPSITGNHDNATSPTDDDAAAWTRSYAPPSTRLRDIIGHSTIKTHLDELLLPLALPSDVYHQVWKGLRAQPPSVLLFGPPGTGKTKLARAVAGEAQAAWISVGPSDILSKYMGESEAAIRRVFQQAQTLAKAAGCCVVFWDEIDALGGSRTSDSDNNDGGTRRILAELLLQFNKLRQQGTENHVILIAATNRDFDLDPALLRRFSMRLYVGYPNPLERRKLVEHFLQDISHNLSRSQLDAVAGATGDWSGAELEHLTREAVMEPIRECLQEAVRKRRHSERTLSTDDESSRDEKSDDDSIDNARECLVSNLQNLRPVTVQDFQRAHDFILGQVSTEEAVALICPRTRASLHIARHESSTQDEEQEGHNSKKREHVVEKEPCDLLSEQTDERPTTPTSNTCCEIV